MSAMIEVLREEHADMARLLDLIDEQVRGPSAPDCELIHEILEYCLTYPDQYHHPKEDLIYRALCRRDRRVTPAIDDLEAEHEELAVRTREFAQVVERARADGAALPDGFDALARSFLDYYRSHMAKEEHLFFPDALKTLTPEEWADLEAQVTDPTDPLFREKAAERLRGLVGRTAT